jgi:hypothetical protein
MLRCHSNQASFTLPVRYYCRDMNVNLKILFKQSDLNFYKKYFYFNSFYGKTIFVRTLNEFFKKKKFSTLLHLFKLRFPLSIFIICPLTFLYYIGIKLKFNFGKYNTFLKPNIKITASNQNV